MNTPNNIINTTIDNQYVNNEFKYCERSIELKYPTLNVDLKTNNDSLNVRLIFFYADWCPHSKLYRPEWNAFKYAVDGKNIDGNIITCIEYDCSNPTDELEYIMEKYNVTEYPSVKLVSNYPNKIDTIALMQPIMRYRNTIIP